MTNRILPTLEQLRCLLHYERDTGVFTWITPTSRRIRRGDAAGTINKGYIRIAINKTRIPAHRIAWLFETGSWPLGEIDHIDHDRKNNRISNLRDATRVENQRNTAKTLANTSGFKGVSWNKKAKKWAASARLVGRSVHLGLFNSPELASDRYLSFSKENHGIFYFNPVQAA